MPEGDKLEIYGNFVMFGLPMVLRGSYAATPPATQSLSLGVAGAQGDPREPTFADALESLGRLVSPRFVLPARPWRSFLDKIVARKVAFVVEREGTGKPTLKLVYDTGAEGELEVDFGFLSFSIRRATVSYGPAGGLAFSLELGRKRIPGIDADTLTWSGSRPDLPVSKISPFTLSYLGLGQRIGVTLTKGSRSVVDAIAEIKEQTQGKYHRDASDPDWRPTFDYDPTSGLFFAADLSLLGEIRAAAVFSDGHLYGLQLAVACPAKRLKFLEGFAGSILYSRGANGQRMFAGRLQLPNGIRTIAFPPLSISIPSFEVMVCTDGSFLIDIGFPANNDFSRSLGLSLLPFVGNGGIKIQRSTCGMAGLPSPGTGAFVSAYAFGLGIRAGLGGEYHWGPISGAITITVSAVFEGTLAMWEPQDKAGESSYYYRLAATVAVEGRIYGKVDLYVLAVGIDIGARAQVQLVLEAYKKATITFEAEVRASGSVKIAFVRISKSFKAHVSRTVEIGGSAGAPWAQAAPKLAAQRRTARRALQAPREGAEPKDLRIPLALCFAASLDLEQSSRTGRQDDARCLVAQPLIRLNRGGDGSPSPFETFLRALLAEYRPGAAFRSYARVDETKALVVGNTRFFFGLEDQPDASATADEFTAFPLPPTFGIEIGGSKVSLGASAGVSAAGKAAATLLDYCLGVARASRQSWNDDDRASPLTEAVIENAARAGAFMMLHGHREMSLHGTTARERPLYAVMGQQFVAPTNLDRQTVAKLSTSDSTETVEMRLAPRPSAFLELWGLAAKGPGAMLAKLAADTVSVGQMPPYRLAPKEFALIDPLFLGEAGQRRDAIYTLPGGFRAALATLGEHLDPWPEAIEEPRVHLSSDDKPDAEWAALLHFTARILEGAGDRTPEGRCVEILGAEAGVSELLLGIIRRAEDMQLFLLCPDKAGTFRETASFALFRAEVSTETHPPRGALRGLRSPRATVVNELKLLHSVGLTNRGGTYLVLLPDPAFVPTFGEPREKDLSLRFLVRCRQSPGAFRYANSVITSPSSDEIVARLSPPAYQIRAGDCLADIAKVLDVDAGTLLAANATSPGLFARDTRILGAKVDAADTALDLAIKTGRSPSALAAALVEAPLAARDGAPRVMLGPAWVHDLPTLPPGVFGFRVLRNKPLAEEARDAAATLTELYHMIRFRLRERGTAGSPAVEIGEDGKRVEERSVMPALGPWEREAVASGEWRYEKTYGAGVWLTQSHGTGEAFSHDVLEKLRFYEHCGKEFSLEVEYLDVFGNAIPRDTRRDVFGATIRHTDPLVSLTHVPGVSLAYQLENEGRAARIRLSLVLDGNRLRDFYEKADYDGRWRFLGFLEQARQQYESEDVTVSLRILVGRECRDLPLASKQPITAFLSAIMQCALGKSGAGNPPPLSLPVPDLRLTGPYGEFRVRLGVERRADSVDDLIPAASEVRRIETPVEPQIDPRASGSSACRDLADFAERAEKAIPSVKVAVASDPGAGGGIETIYLVDRALLAARFEADAELFACRPLSASPRGIAAEPAARELLADVESALRPGIADRLLQTGPHVHERLLAAKGRLAEAIASQVAVVLVGDGRRQLRSVAVETLRQEALSDLGRAYGDKLIVCFVMKAGPAIPASIALQGSVIDVDSGETVCDAKMKGLGDERSTSVVAFPYSYGDKDYGRLVRKRFLLRVEFLEVEIATNPLGKELPQLSRWLRLARPIDVALTAENGQGLPMISRFPAKARLVGVGNDRGALEMRVAFMAPTLASDRIEYGQQSSANEGDTSTPARLFAALATYRARRGELMKRLRPSPGDNESRDAAANEFVLLVADVAEQWQALWSKVDAKKAKTLRAPAAKAKDRVPSVALGPTAKVDRPRASRNTQTEPTGEASLRVVDRDPHGVRIRCEIGSRGRDRMAGLLRNDGGMAMRSEEHLSLVRNDIDVAGRRIAPEFLMRTVCDAQTAPPKPSVVESRSARGRLCRR